MSDSPNRGNIYPVLPDGGGLVSSGKPGEILTIPAYMRRGAGIPVLSPAGDLGGNCQPTEGGAKLPSVGEYVLEVKNVPDLFWRDDDFTLHTEDDGSTIIIDG